MQDLDGEAFNERCRQFKEFIDSDYGETLYRDRLNKMIDKGQTRLIVNINHLRNFNRAYADGLLNDPVDFLPAFDKALADLVLAANHDSTASTTDTSNKTITYSVGLEGSFGDNQISFSKLNSTFLGKLVSIQGIVSRCSLVRPKVVKSVHYCELTQQFISREYRDQHHLGHQLQTNSIYPKEDDSGNPLTTEFGLSTYRGTQTITMQEMPERAPAGQMPHPIEILLDNDLADACKPGDRVQVVGVYRSTGKSHGGVSATFKTLILANNIKQLGKSVNRFTVTEKDIQQIKKLGKRKNIFDLLSNSLAPSIFGHEYIKKAVLLQMLGGMEKNLDNGTHIRGDINILMVGDPSTAKSQMLRFVLNTAPLAIATTGRGSSGVGLTAAVTMDKETGERRLEAGAMVLADRGIVCIDEFDKMNDIDRVAIHEVMEQQTVTIAKAGIHTSLNARCSVIAAANPVMGQYVDTKEPSKNINLPDSLLSRFDLLFIVLDNLEDEHNRSIAEHVVRMHRYVSPQTEEGLPINEDAFEGVNSFAVQNDVGNDSKELEETAVFEKFDELLHIGLKPLKPVLTPKKSKKKKNAASELVSIPFIRKYIQHAKTSVMPVLTAEAASLISENYSRLRTWEDGREKMFRVMPITARTLETLIRLSSAHAKCRLSSLVEEADVEVALEVLEYALYKEVKSKPRKAKKPKVNKSAEDSMSESEESSDDDDDDNKDDETRGRSNEKKGATPADVASSSMDIDDDDDNEDEEQVGKQRTGYTSTGFEQSQSSTISFPVSTQEPVEGLTEERMDVFESQLNSARVFDRQDGGDGETLSYDRVLELINRGIHAGEEFSQGEVKKALRTMNDDNRVWFREEQSQLIFM